MLRTPSIGASVFGHDVTVIPSLQMEALEAGRSGTIFEGADQLIVKVVIEGLLINGSVDIAAFNVVFRGEAVVGIILGFCPMHAESVGCTE
jgi:hypothetical protein